MKSNKIEFAVGFFLLLGLVALGVLAFKIGGARYVMGQGAYSLQARFTDVSGLNPGSGVFLGGVRVGSVKSLRLDAEEFVAMVEMRLSEDLTLDDDTIASIRSRGLLGEKYISLSPGGSGLPLEPGDTIVDTEPSLDIESLIGKVAFGSLDSKKEEEGEK